MGKPEKRARCKTSGKLCFVSRDEALRELRSIRANPDPVKHALGYMPTQVYQCGSCHRWHLSFRGATKYQRRRKRKGAKAWK
ncbi:hypothetical protein B0I32_1072 [Nonomuraea fuscirosea]|uniref:Uncharacterized protein n=1 Tax=Nonomuraea fuscirosea TaxID=1291556 RepID=A0A2T0N0F0_9ACTN|nr:hypothetical protein [Nonomuraea fuscirosea]PRX65243.1 hypothetical protein B0I32_1072 [Nonomuraea fuscirosea]